MTSTWQMHRAGFIDFWYYGQEEFYFSDGRLLLRGANGSGKSVTMQSILPLLLDGDKSPSRLDPFGSTSRLMQNYLLMENDDREERTGYLYLEFRRAEADAFLTLGIGMRARRNRPLDSWYFIITDGRRVGRDFLLTKNIGKEIALTKQELKFRLDTGGLFFELQGEYMKAVNNHLFGYDDTQNYRELLDLLIQLRSPKLTKDYKPTVLHEILSSSLQGLTDDDLRPMSETIEKIDRLKSLREEHELSLRSTDSILYSYNRFNEAILWHKAQYLVKKDEQVLLHKRQTNENILETEKKQSLLDDAIRLKEEYLEEQQVLTQKIRQFEDQDLKKLKEQELTLISLIAQKKTRMEGLDEKVRQLFVRLQQLQDRSREIDTQNYRLEKNIRQMLEGMEDVFNLYTYDEHAFMKAEILEDIRRSYSYTMSKTTLQQLLELVEQALELLKEQDFLRQQISELEEEKSKTEREIVRLERELEKSYQLLGEMKLELQEKTARFFKNAKVFTISPEALDTLIRLLDEVGIDTDFYPLRERMQELQLQVSSDIKEKIREKSHLLEGTDEQIALKEREIQELEIMEDPQPPREASILKNRLKLHRMGIEARPLFELLEFRGDVDSYTQGVIEEILSDLGLLDAMVVHEEFREELMRVDPGNKERYIFIDHLSHAYIFDRPLFVPEDFPGRDSLESRLSELFYGVENRFSIDLNGLYQNFLVEGVVSADYQAKYIGREARKRHREELLKEARSEHQELLGQRREIVVAIEALEEKHALLLEEAALYPGFSDLQSAIALIRQAEEHIKQERSAQQRLLSSLYPLYEKAKQLEEMLYKFRGKIHLQPSLKEYTLVGKELSVYRDHLYELESMHKEFIQLSERVREYAELIQEQEARLQDVRDDRAHEERECSLREKELAATVELLQQSDYSKYEEELTLMLLRQSELPALISSVIEKMARTAEQIRYHEEELASLKENEAVFLKELEDAKNIFCAEWKLGLTQTQEPAMEQPQEQARSVMRNLPSVTKEELDNRRQLLLDSYYNHRSVLAGHSVSLREVFAGEFAATDISVARPLAEARVHGVYVGIARLKEFLEENLESTNLLIRDGDRKLFEEVLGENLSLKIRAKVSASRNWVARMNELMENLSTSAGLSLRLVWKAHGAQKEDQLSTTELVQMMNRDVTLLRPEDKEKFSEHFRSKVEEARIRMETKENQKSFHQLMREILDYRQWFEFQLLFKKAGQEQKELTNNEFFKLSGGEKAICMYMPLFAAVVAKYNGAGADAPRIISLDEAFAGVDENNIQQMFDLMVELKFNFIINSQNLWGDYPTVPALNIYEMLPDHKTKTITPILHHWDGWKREVIFDSELMEASS